jgi:hypothetical protein
LGITANLARGVFEVSEKRVSSLFDTLGKVTDELPFTSARKLAKLTGKIISTKWVLGEITQLKTRNLYRAIDKSPTWDRIISLNQHTQAIIELVFWRKNFKSLNARRIKHQMIPDLLIASDASETGIGAHTQVGTQQLIVCKILTPKEGAQSSAHREVYAILYALSAFKRVCAHKSVLWFTDNFAASRIVAKGSGKENLQSMSEKIFTLCKNNDIDLKVQWVPRETISYADHLSKLVDHDDWCTTSGFFNRASGALTRSTDLQRVPTPS